MDELEKVKVKKFTVKFQVNVVLLPDEEPKDLATGAELVADWADKILDDGSDVTENPITEGTNLVGKFVRSRPRNDARVGVYELTREVCAWADEVAEDPIEGAAQIVDWMTEEWTNGFEVKDCPITGATDWSAAYVGEGEVDV